MAGQGLRLDFMTNDQLLPFFHCSKSEISCMKNPQLFLNQLRDHNLIPEDRYKKLSRMKSKENFKNALYDFLDWLEKEKCIRKFWECVFRKVVMDNYPTLKKMCSSLFDGSFSFYSQPVNEEMQEDTNDKKGLLVEEKSQINSVNHDARPLPTSAALHDARPLPTSAALYDARPLPTSAIADPLGEEWSSFGLTGSFAASRPHSRSGSASSWPLRWLFVNCKFGKLLG